MSDMARPHPRWTDERLDRQFEDLRKSIDSNRNTCTSEIADIKSDLGNKHQQNRKDIEMLQTGQATILGTVNTVDRKQDTILFMLETAVGDGKDPKQGRIGRLEGEMEVMKKFKWQFMAVVSFAFGVLGLIEKFHK